MLIRGGFFWKVRPGLLGAVILALTVLLFPVDAAPAPVRLAVGPFFASSSSDDLRQAAQALPELLTVELSHLPRFTLIEREKVDQVWSELRLDSAGLVSRDKVTRLGRMLSCDWIVSGSLVEADGRRFLWTRVIDARVGVVVDLQAYPFQSGVLTNVAVQMATFVDQSGRRPIGRQFVAMGPIIDLNPSTVERVEGRDDWSRRVSALLEKHFLDSGLGVVEIAAVGPIFEERRLENAGLTGHPEQRVRLQSAFWLIDGGCDWVEAEDRPAQVSVRLRIQRAGGPPQMLGVTNLPGARLEQDVLALVARAFTQTNDLPGARAGADPEADLLVARGREMAEYRSPFRPRMPKSPQWMTQWDQYVQMREQHAKKSENRRALMANYERLSLKDPKNVEAKTMLAYCWIGEGDVARQERALELFRDVAANKENPEWAAKAKRFLSDAAMIEKIRGSQARSTFPRPRDWHSLNMAYQESPNDPEIQCDLGDALINMPRAHDRKRGREMLTAVAAGNNPTQAERAQRLLAQPEKTPALPEPPPQPAAKVEPLPPEDDDERARREFFQANFNKFIPVKFELVTPGQGLKARAKIQRLPVRQNTLRFGDRLYCGFRFVVPERVGGGLEWMFLLAKSEAQKDFEADEFQWYIVPKKGRTRGFRSFATHSVSEFPTLGKQFPHTEDFYEQRLDEECLTPGQEYAIWFRFKQSDLPDIAFALTLTSLFGHTVYGQLPLVQ